MARRKKQPGWKIGATSAENAARVLPWLAARFFEAGREAVGVSPRGRSLHKLRLRGKRLRYSLELFAACFGPGLEHRLSEIKKVQNYLGEISDCDATMRLIKKSGLAGGEDGPRFLQFLEARSEAHISRFVEHWRVYFDAPGQLEAWLFYLKHYAGRGMTAARTPQPTKSAGAQLSPAHGESTR